MVNSKRKIRRMVHGLNREAIIEISRDKAEPGWMLEKRLRGLDLFLKKPMPDWGANLSGLDLDSIVYFPTAGAEEKSSFEDLPVNIRRDFDRLGIPHAEHKLFSGSGAQWDADPVYHKLKEAWTKQGVIFENMDEAVKKRPDLVKHHFMTDCVPVSDHKFAALHAAVWSGGTFVYVPKGVKVTAPLHAYFRIASRRAGQFEHTLIIADEGSEVDYIEGCSAPRYTESSLHAGCVEIHVKAGAVVRYASVENWSRNVYNLNTKRALVDAGGSIEWLGGNMGSGATMLYPTSVLRGAGARSDYLGLAFAGPGQELDTGVKAIHAAPDTVSTSRSRSLSRGGGRSTFRGLVRMTAAAEESRAAVSCDALLLDARSESRTYPSIRVDNASSEVSHEAKVGKMGDEEIFCLMSRGLNEEQARKMIVNGFVEPVVRRLPLEYAVELNKLVDMELSDSVG